MTSKFFWTIANVILRRKSDRPINLSEPSRILMLRYGFLGDILQTTPAIRAVAERWPKARIDYWVSKYAAPALENNPRINKVFFFDAPEGTLYARARLFVLQMRALRQQRYDLVFCFSANPLYGALCWLAGVKIRMGIIDSPYKTTFLHRWVVSTPDDRTNRQLLYEKLIGLAGASLTPTTNKIEVFWKTEDSNYIETLLPDIRTKLIALFTGSGPNVFRPWAKRAWPVQSWIEIIKKLSAQYPDYHFVLLGRGNDGAVNEIIIHSLKQIKYYDLTDKTTVPQLACALSKCNLLISTDSLPVFTAAAVGCPMVVVYGPEWPERAQPEGPTDWYPVFTEVDCRENCAAFKDPGNGCDGRCMEGITVEQVSRSIEVALKKKSSKNN